MINVGVIDLVIEYQFEVIEQLVDKGHIKLQHVLSGAPENFHGDVGHILQIDQKLRTGGAKVDVITSMIFAENIAKLPITPWSVSLEMLEDLKKTESKYMRITDRASSVPISVQERRLYYLILVNYFYNIIKRHELSHIIVFDTPHSLASSIYYDLADYLGVVVLRMEYHFLSEYSLFYKGIQSPRVPSDYLTGWNIDEIRKDMPLSLRDVMDQTNDYFESYKTGESKSIIGGGVGSWMKLYWRYLKKCVQNLIMGLLPFLFERRVLHFTSLNDITSSLRYRLLANRLVSKIISQNRYYNRVSHDVDLSAKFVFFGLHMQPEKSTTPLGGEYDHQLLCVALLAECIPDDWKVYVKEHPNQFNVKKLSNANYRNKHFYDVLSNIPKVELVSLSISSDYIIDHAQLISTVTGSIGWEALLKGKPVVAFGDAYYKACRAVGHMNSPSQGILEIKRLLQMSPEEVKKELLIYFHFLHHNGHLLHAANWERKIQLSARPRAIHVKTITNRFVEAISEMS